MSHKSINQLSFGETFIKRKANVNKTLAEIDTRINWERISKVLNKIYDNKHVGILPNLKIKLLGTDTILFTVPAICSGDHPSFNLL